MEEPVLAKSVLAYIAFVEIKSKAQFTKDFHVNIFPHSHALIFYLRLSGVAYGTKREKAFVYI